MAPYHHISIVSIISFIEENTSLNYERKERKEKEAEKERGREERRGGRGKNKWKGREG